MRNFWIPSNITCNKKYHSKRPENLPFVTSGVRLGTPAVTSRGLNTADMDQIAEAIAMMIKEGEPAADKAKANREIFDREIIH